MALWNFTHGVLHMHFWLLPSIIVAVVMAVTGAVHGRNQKKRKEDYEEELRGETPEAPEADSEEVSK